MRIINVVFMVGGLINSIESYPIYEEQLEDDVVKEAERRFARYIKTYYISDNNENIDDIIIEAIEDGYFVMEKYEVCLLWSNIIE